MVFEHAEFAQNMTSCQSFGGNSIDGQQYDGYKVPDLNKIYAKMFEKHVQKLNIPSENDFRAEVSFFSDKLPGIPVI